MDRSRRRRKSGPATASSGPRTGSPGPAAPGRSDTLETAAALVYDSSIFGATGPLVGRRYRFEYSQMAGTLAFGGLLADYRRYFMPVRPFTVAVRGLHYARYGADFRAGERRAITRWSRCWR